MYDFCGIGNSCIDICANVDDTFLTQWDFPKSICTYLPLHRANGLEACLPAPQYIAGGCAANTASIVAALGGQSAFMGRVAKDAIGEMFMDDLQKRGIYFPCAPDETPGAGSTRVFALITPDTERTFAAYYGVQEDLSVADIDEDSVRQSKFMYLDGYALNSRRGADAFLKAAEISHSASGRVVFAPSDLSILNTYPDAVSALEKASDIILCSGQEASFMTGEERPEDAVRALKTRYSMGTVTSGVDGVYVFDENGVSHVPAAIPPAPVTDTNGAGDAFAGGFLFGLSRGMAKEDAAALGNRCAAAIITHAGARPVHDLTKFL